MIIYLYMLYSFQNEGFVFLCRVTPLIFSNTREAGNTENARRRLPNKTQKAET
jgi:hypothetical protein